MYAIPHSGCTWIVGISPAMTRGESGGAVIKVLE